MTRAGQRRRSMMAGGRLTALVGLRVVGLTAAGGLGTGGLWWCGCGRVLGVPGSVGVMRVRTAPR